MPFDEEGGMTPHRSVLSMMVRGHEHAAHEAADLGGPLFGGVSRRAADMPKSTRMNPDRTQTGWRVVK